MNPTKSKFGDPALILQNKRLAKQQLLDELAGDKTYVVSLNYSYVVCTTEKGSRTITLQAEDAASAVEKAEEALSDSLTLEESEELQILKATVVDVVDPAPKDKLTVDMFNS